MRRGLQQADPERQRTDLTKEGKRKMQQYYSVCMYIFQAGKPKLAIPTNGTLCIKSAKTKLELCKVFFTIKSINECQSYVEILEY